MIRLVRIMEGLPTNAQRRAVALDVWQAYGGPIADLKRAVERERKATARAAIEGQVLARNGPLFSAELGDNKGTTEAISSVVPPVPPNSRVFEVPKSIQEALSKSDFLGGCSALHRPEYWKAEIRANPRLNYAGEVLKAEAWIQAHWERRPRKRPGQFLHRWLSKAEAPE